jgi:DNA-binding transcriptional regulator YiaG
VEVPELEIPTCRSCGERVFTNWTEEQIYGALRVQLRLLTPQQIREAVQALGMRQKEVAERLGIAEETLSRWIHGTVIQSRAMDNLLRAYFASPALRLVLLGPEQDPAFGATVTI